MSAPVAETKLSWGQRLTILGIALFAASFLAIAIFGALRGDTAAARHISAVPPSEVKMQPMKPGS
ncbi:hypothetical protein ACMS1Z_10835 [Acidiphilium multivorum]|jgi:hypothetical protein|uniref:hypothetical protein n=1 Tax=Acidiphilium multivorum TaxID=62140 RepID=UPI0039C97CD1